MKTITEMNLEALAQLAVTLEGWEWRDGMAYTYDGLEHHRIIRVLTPMSPDEPVAFLRERKGYAMEWELQGTERPDLTDPATLGCIEAMCRAKHGEGFFVERRQFSALYPALPRPNRYENSFVYRGSTTYVTPLLTSPGPHSQNVILKVTEWQDTRAHALVASLATEAKP